MKRISLALALSALLILVGCGRDDDQAAVDVPPVDDDIRTSLFERIDANSIYLMANLEPLPEKLSELMWDSLEAMSEPNQEIYGDFIEGVDHPMTKALMREFMAIDSREALEARGLHGNGLWALHGLSLYPVLHWQLVDPDAFTGMLDRIAGEAGMDLPRRGVGDEEILWIDSGDFGLAIHHDDKILTAAIVPDDMSLLRRIAGLDRPSQSYSATQLQEFNRERGFASQGSGFFDFGLLIERLLDDDDLLVAAGRQAANLSSLAEDPACSAELRALASVFPRVSSGATHLTNNEIAASMVFETERGLGEKLSAITDSPVRLDADPAALFSAGLAFNLVAARDLAREIVGGWVDNPPQCEMFAAIRENAADWQLAVNRPIPPVVTNLQGFRLTVDQMEFGAMGPSDAVGTLAVFMRNPQMMVGMAQMFSPELAALELRPGGDPQPLPQGLIPNMPQASGWVAMGQNSIGLAVGEDQKEKLMATLEPGRAGSAILRYGIDFTAYAEMLEAMMARTRAQLEEVDGDFEMPDGNEKIIATMGEIYDYSEFSVHLKPHGIEINSLMRLHD